MLVYLQVKLDDVMQAVLFYVGSEQTLKMCELKEKKGQVLLQGSHECLV